MRFTPMRSLCLLHRPLPHQHRAHRAHSHHPLPRQQRSLTTIPWVVQLAVPWVAASSLLQPCSRYCFVSAAVEDQISLLRRWRQPRKWPTRHLTLTLVPAAWIHTPVTTSPLRQHTVQRPCGPLRPRHRSSPAQHMAPPHTQSPDPAPM
jgi:hypothetical protein